MAFVVYKSSAGSGKTYTLTKEFLKLALGAEQKDYYKRILAITFTNKAAAEMKHRILSSLQDFATGNVSIKNKALFDDIVSSLKEKPETITERSKSAFYHMLHHYSDLSISTIDKFIHKIVRTFAHDLNIPINFEVSLDEELLLSESIHKLLDEADENKELMDFLIQFAQEKADDNKSWNIEKDLFTYAKDILSDENTEYLKKLSSVNLHQFNLAKNHIHKVCRFYEEQMYQLGQEAITCMFAYGINPEDMYYGKTGIAGFFKKLATKNNSDFGYNSYVLKTINEDKWCKDKIDPASKQAILSAKEKFKAIFNQFLSLKEKDGAYYLKLSLIKKNINKLALLNEIERFFIAVRKEENLLNISDFNKRIADIVNSEPIPFLYERLGERYSHFLIDEFQDTSILQWQNLLPLVDNALAEGNFNMVVGDSKQAIYRWRGGEVEQLDELPYLLKKNNNPVLQEREDALVRNYKKEILRTNFRSSPNIVEFNNHFFETTSSLLNSKFKTIYNDQAQLYRDAQNKGYVKVEILPGKDSESYKNETLNKVVHSIYRYTESGFKLNDIAVICRGNADLVLISDFLKQHQIPVLSSESLLLCTSEKVKLIGALLCLISSPWNKSFYLDVISAAVENNVLALEEAFTLLNANSFKLDQVLKEILKTEIGLKVEFYNYSTYELAELLINLLFDPSDPYLISMLDACLEFSKSNPGASLQDFNTWWKEKKKKYSLIIPEGTEAVKLFTIHKSKGLEFPVVLAPFVSWQMKNQKNQEWISGLEEQPENLPVALIPLSGKDINNTAFSELLELEKQKTVLDNLNLLYVCFTRARISLEIFTSDNIKENNINSIVSSYLPGNLLAENPNCYTFGEFPAGNPQETSTSKNIKNLTGTRHKNWRKKIHITAGKYSNENKESKQWLGNAIHRGLELYHLQNGNFEFLEQLLQSEGWGNKSELKEVLATIKTVTTSAPYFDLTNGSEVIFTEREIITQNKQILRPDILLKKDNTFLLIDYKTGEKKKEHMMQINEYAGYLKELGYSPLTMHLVYTHTTELISL